MMGQQRCSWMPELLARQTLEISRTSCSVLESKPLKGRSRHFISKMLKSYYCCCICTKYQLRFHDDIAATARAACSPSSSSMGLHSSGSRGGKVPMGVLGNS
jgi:hypothetical protein